MHKELGLYIHIPFCKQKCNYCDFASYPNMDEYWGLYNGAVISELSYKSSEFKDAIIKSIFIGGGTPSLIPYSHIVNILNAVYSKYKVLDECEISIESNPGTLTIDKLKAYRDSGINRLSIGLQACQDSILKKLGRIHNWKDFESSVNLAYSIGLTNINADLIFGIPGQTFEDWEFSLEQVLPLNLTHFSCYSLKIEEGTVFGRMIEEGSLGYTDDELDRKMYHYTIERLDKDGFIQYELSNFAKPSYQCKHNMNYWERGEYIGVGAGAHSFIGNRRFANTPEVLSYIKGVQSGELVLSEDSFIDCEEALSEKIILGLRLKQGINIAQLSEEFGFDIKSKYDTNINLLIKRELVELEGSMIRLTKKGMDLANQVFVEFI